MRERTVSSESVINVVQSSPKVIVKMEDNSPNHAMIRQVTIIVEELSALSMRTSTFQLTGKRKVSSHLAFTTSAAAATIAAVYFFQWSKPAAAAFTATVFASFSSAATVCNGSRCIITCGTTNSWASRTSSFNLLVQIFSCKILHGFNSLKSLLWTNLYQIVKSRW